MLGYPVDPNSLNMKAYQIALDLRTVFSKVDQVAGWLADHPVVNNTDPLTAEPYNYTQDEAYLLRVYFEGWEDVRTSQGTTELFTKGRKLTGLE